MFKNPCDVVAATNREEVYRTRDDESQFLVGGAENGAADLIEVKYEIPEPSPSIPSSQNAHMKKELLLCR